MAAESMRTSVFLGHNATMMELYSGICRMDKRGLAWTKRLVRSEREQPVGTIAISGRMTGGNIANTESFHGGV